MDEDRVYDDRRRETVAYLATGQGVATVRVASDRVGRFGLAHRCEPHDVATGGGQVYVATPTGVLAATHDGSADPGGFDSLGFDDAVAVTAADERVLAADAGGTVARYRDGEWHSVGTVDDVRTLSGEFVAASDGVYRVAGDGAGGGGDAGDSGGDSLRNVGLDDVRDVAGDGVPLAATGDGLYRLGNGWLCEREGVFETVATGRTGGGERAHAATAGTLYAREDGEWPAVELPVDEAVTGVAYGECVYAVTRDGTFFVQAEPERTADGTGGWRHRSLGLPGVAGLAVV